MLLDATLLNTQHYKVRIKGKVEQSREWSNAPLSLHLGVVAIEKEAFGSSSTKGRQLYFYLLHKNVNMNVQLRNSMNKISLDGLTCR